MYLLLRQSDCEFIFVLRNCGGPKFERRKMVKRLRLAKEKGSQAVAYRGSGRKSLLLTQQIGSQVTRLPKRIRLLDLGSTTLARSISRTRGSYPRSGGQGLAWLAGSPDLGVTRHRGIRTTLDTPLPKSLPGAKKKDFAGCEGLCHAE